MPHVPRLRLRPRISAIVAVLAALSSACERSEPAARADTSASANPASTANTAITPATVSAAQFAQLRWLEGQWRGEGGGVPAFFEGYRSVDDSTIRKYDFGDSTFRTPTDSGDITLRGGRIRSGSSAQSWVAVALDSASVRFAPERGASNGFEWRRGAPGAWTARLTWDSAGLARERVYQMRAAGPGPTRK